MTEADSKMVKPETPKTSVWLQTSDGSIQEVEQEVAMFCPFLWHEIHLGMGSSENCPISLPSNVNAPVFSLILDYCRFHQVSGRSKKEKKSFDEKFLHMDAKSLCELTGAADSLQLSPLVALTSRAIARAMNGRTAEEIREIFHLPDDLTEEEKLEPIRNTMDNPRIRLWNRLQAKKREELKEIERLKESGEIDSAENHPMVHGNFPSDLGDTAKLLDFEDGRVAPEDEFDDCGVDLALKEKIDSDLPLYVDNMIVNSGSGMTRQFANFMFYLVDIGSGRFCSKIAFRLAWKNARDSFTGSREKTINLVYQWKWPVEEIHKIRPASELILNACQHQSRHRTEKCRLICLHGWIGNGVPISRSISKMLCVDSHSSLPGIFWNWS
ncbi:SKP1-like protein 21 [Forsythia ovata]|uniref:SKP1-like protein 21 n=1 Tax=Forsythia ovata TaxID=205694 RepID=A0ABD1PXQ2_9LAMI